MVVPWQTVKGSEGTCCRTVRFLKLLCGFFRPEGNIWHRRSARPGVTLLQYALVLPCFTQYSVHSLRLTIEMNRQVIYTHQSTGYKRNVTLPWPSTLWPKLKEASVAFDVYAPTEHTLNHHDPAQHYDHPPRSKPFQSPGSPVLPSL